MKMAGLYARVSSDRQREDNMIASQTAALKAFAAAHGFDVPERRGLQRRQPGATRPGTDPRPRSRGAHPGGVVHSPDRLSRKYAYQVLLTKEFSRHGVETLFVKAPQSASPEDQFLVEFQRMIAEYERAQIRERSRRGKRHRAKAGEVSVLGGAPYGYRYVKKTDVAPARFEILAAEAEVVRPIFDQYTRAGLSIGAVARLPNDQGLPTRRQAPRWERSTVWGILRNPAYRGSACFGKTQTAPRQRVTRPRRLAGRSRRGETTATARPRADWIEIPVPALVSEIAAELDRRLAAACAADPTRQRQAVLERELLRVGKATERLVTAYQEELLSLKELRSRLPELRRREQGSLLACCIMFAQSIVRPWCPSVNRLGQQFRRAVASVSRSAVYALPPKPQRLLFDHMYKCGGMSLIAYLQMHYPARKAFLTGTPNLDASVERFRALPTARRNSYQLICGHSANALIDYCHPSTTIVTLLRDPVDRIVSHYFYVKENPTHHLYQVIHERNLSLKNYATSEISAELSNWYTIHFSGMEPPEVEQNPEEAYEKALNCLLSRYHLIGFLDRITDFTAALRRKVRLRYPFGDTRRNVTRRRLPLDQVTQSARQSIYEANRLDVALYDSLLAKRGRDPVIEQQ